MGCHRRSETVYNPPMTSDNNQQLTMDLLVNGASELGLELSPTQLGQFDLYYRELADWGQRVNLTSIKEHAAVQVKHFLDSLTVLLAYPEGMPPDLRIVDIGAGAGFPGLPLKLVFPDTSLLLVESVGKKARFLEHLVESLPLTNVEVITGRAEEVARAPERRERYDLAVSRGVAKMAVLLEYTLPYCAVGGRTVSLNHRSVEKEFAGAARALETLGGHMGEVYPVNLAGLTDERIVVVVEKVRKTPGIYPRPIGVPRKKPL